VLILLYDSPAFHICFLATLAIGAIPVPINPHLKENSLLYTLTDSEAKAIIVESNLAEHVSSIIQHAGIKPLIFFQDLYTTHQNQIQLTDTRILSLRQLNSKYRNITQFEFFSKKESDIAFWQYTSGTTGKPKAVMHTGKGMLESYRLFAQQTLQLTAKDKYYSAAKMFFGYGLGNSLFFPLLSGASTLLENRWSDIHVVIENLNRFKPTVFFAMPAIYSQLIKQIDYIENDVFANLRVCFSAGSPLPKSIFEQWQHHTKLDIYDGIGATEIGHVFLCNSKKAVKAGSTGKLVQGYEVKIIDKNGLEVGQDNIGVLLVKGSSLSEGYWKQPEITRTKFIGDWYRTGDLFSRDSENYFYYHGREDDLFKVKGRWVEPFEVEGLLLKHFKHIISETKLVGIENNDGLIEANLFVICNKHHTFDKNQLSEDIMTLLKSKVERHKLPSHIHYVSAFLCNENGKIVNELLRQLVS
jgi:acyl-coenzyme A synthetase/AMP-(fatty) acid ligase